jgi:hypothetical protein
MFLLQCGCFEMLASLLLLLALIWFSDEIVSIPGYLKSGYVNVETPAIMISIMSWFFYRWFTGVVLFSESKLNCTP